MRTLKFLLLAAGALSLQACTSVVAVRPYESRVGSTPMTALDDAYAQGKSHYLANRLGLAIACFERALAADPGSVATLNAIGAAYDDLHRYDIAMAYYDKALEIDPLSADTYNNMGVSLIGAGRREEADAAFARAARLDPQNPTVRENVARATGRFSPVIVGVAEDEDDPTRPRIVRTGEDQFALYVPEAGAVVRSARAALSGKGRRGTFMFTVERGEPNIALPREAVTVEPLLPPKG